MTVLAFQPRPTKPRFTAIFPKDNGNIQFCRIVPPTPVSSPSVSCSQGPFVYHLWCPVWVLLVKVTGTLIWKDREINSFLRLVEGHATGTEPGDEPGSIPSTACLGLPAFSLSTVQRTTDSSRSSKPRPEQNSLESNRPSPRPHRSEQSTSLSSHT